MNSLISYISASKTRLYIARDHHFFAYTQTRDEVSMVLTESSLKLFPDNVLKVTASPWRALSVSLGSSGYTGTGIISTLSNILSQAKINIFYLSTANTDFILVQEEKLEKAIQSLRENFDILTEGEESLLTIEEEKSDFDVTSIKQNLVTVSSADAVVFDPSKSAGLSLYLLPDVMYLCSLAKDNRPLVAQALLQHVFYPETSVGFFTFVETEDEISLLIAKEHIKNFPEDAFTVSDIWRPIQRFRKSNFSEIGVISALSAPIARAKIPILYISTFTSAYLMVQYKNVSATTMCLESQKYHVEQLKMNDSPPEIMEPQVVQAKRPAGKKDCQMLFWNLLMMSKQQKSSTILSSTFVREILRTQRCDNFANLKDLLREGFADFIGEVDEKALDRINRFETTTKDESNA